MKYLFTRKTANLRSLVNIKKLRDETNTKTDLLVEGAEAHVIEIRGPKEDDMKVKKRLLKISNEKPLVGHTAEIKANLEPHKFLIGRNGASIKKVLDNTGARNVFPNENDDDKNTIASIGRKEESVTSKNELNSSIAQLKDIVKKKN
ncbi:vigilin [Nephila pilipes]|uniref:Vigilin n=1 Tax=Nephila pilipes TaxID=299642 RepID=A0A8X6T619_NEPPI|nr:vigilin [Nephila pilipes]